jgi:hypothetical protein
LQHRMQADITNIISIKKLSWTKQGKIQINN